MEQQCFHPFNTAHILKETGEGEGGGEKAMHNRFNRGQVKAPTLGLKLLLLRPSKTTKGMGLVGKIIQANIYKQNSAPQSSLPISYPAPWITKYRSSNQLVNQTKTLHSYTHLTGG